MTPAKQNLDRARAGRAKADPFTAAAAFLMLLIFCLSPNAQAATITVDSLADSNPIAVDGNCTLREAIVSANTNMSDDCTAGDGAPTIDTIEFNVAGTITLALQLPATIEPVIIDGYSAPGAGVNTDALASNAILTVVVDANGANVGLPVDSAATVRGLVVQNYVDWGIEVQDDGDGTVIAGNFVGTSADGLSGSGAASSENIGIRVQAGADNVIIGGTDAAARNLVSDNGITGIAVFSDGNTIQGNLVGTDATGMAALPNTVDRPNNDRPAIRIQGSSNNQVGGATAAERNVISGNNGDAMQVLGGSSNNVIEGNYIGVDITGNGALPQARSGILLFTGPGAAAGSSDNVQIIDNVVAAMPEKGIVADGPPFTNTVIDGNLVGVGADGTTALGIGLGEPLDPEPGIAIAGLATARVSNNVIVNNAIGLQIEDPTSQLLANSTGNCIVFNDVGVENTTDDTTIDIFESNWWGQPDGPSGSGPGSGDSVTGSGTTDVDPFLVSAPLGCPSYQADLVITKADSVDPVIAGTQMTYMVTVENLGPQDAIDVVVTDTLPAGATLVSTTGCVEDPNGVATCTLGDLAATASAGYTIMVNVDPSASGQLSNSASASSGTADPDAANSSTSETTNVVSEANLGITKTDNADPVTGGATFIYTINVSNAGPSDAANVQVTDTLPAGVTLVSTTGCVEDPAGVPTCTLGTVPALGNASLDIEVQVDLGFQGTLNNSASVSSSANDPDGGNDIAAESTEVTAASSDLELTITNDAIEPVAAGDQFTVTLTLDNNGPQDNANVMVAGTLSGLQFVSSACATSSGNAISWNVGALGAMQTAICSLQVEAGAFGGEVVASASGDVGDPAPGNNTDITTSVVAEQIAIPMLDRWGLVVLVLALMTTALVRRNYGQG